MAGLLAAAQRNVISRFMKDPKSWQKVIRVCRIILRKNGCERACSANWKNNSVSSPLRARAQTFLTSFLEHSLIFIHRDGAGTYCEKLLSGEAHLRAATQVVFRKRVRHIVGRGSE